VDGITGRFASAQPDASRTLRDLLRPLDLDVGRLLDPGSADGVNAGTSNGEEESR